MLNDSIIQLTIKSLSLLNITVCGFVSISIGWGLTILLDGQAGRQTPLVKENDLVRNILQYNYFKIKP